MNSSAEVWHCEMLVSPDEGAESWVIYQPSGWRKEVESVAAFHSLWQSHPPPRGRHMKTERPWWELYRDFRRGSGQPITFSRDTSPAAAVGNQVMRDWVSVDTDPASMWSLQVLFVFQSPKYLWSDYIETVAIQIEPDHLPEVVSIVHIRCLTDMETESGLN